MDLEEVGDTGWIPLAKDRGVWRLLLNAVIDFWVS